MITWPQSLTAGFAVLFLTIGIVFSIGCAFAVLKLLFEKIFKSRTVDVPVGVTLHRPFYDEDPSKLAAPIHGYVPEPGPENVKPPPKHPNGPMSAEDESKLTPTELIDILASTPGFTFKADVDLPKALPTPYTLQGDAIVRAPGEYGAQVFLKQGRTVYIVPPAEADPEIMAARRAALGLVEVIGVQCADGGKCHHSCTEKCARKDGCVPLSAAKWLNDDWSLRK